MDREPVGPQALSFAESSGPASQRAITDGFCMRKPPGLAFARA
jgi:hypothetical protein